MAEFGVESPRQAMHRVANDFEDDKVRQQPQPPAAVVATAAEERNWAELPRDALSVIFLKMGAFHVMNGAQWVCRPWRQLSREPETWRVVNMTEHPFDPFFEEEPLFGAYLRITRRCWSEVLLEMAREVITRSNGQMEEFHARDFGDDCLMEFIAERTNGRLKHLCLIACTEISDKGLIELAKRSPHLEHLEISLCAFTTQFIEPIGQACPQLKVFRMNWEYPDFDSENCYLASREALQIANNMQQLVELQMVGSLVNNVELEAILDKCLKLEILHLSDCDNLEINENLRNKCARIRDLRLPQDDLHEWDYEYDDYGCGGSYNDQFDYFNSD